MLKLLLFSTSLCLIIYSIVRLIYKGLLNDMEESEFKDEE